MLQLDSDWARPLPPVLLVLRTLLLTKIGIIIVLGITVGDHYHGAESAVKRQTCYLIHNNWLVPIGAVV